MGRDTKRKLTLRKRHFLVIEKYIEDVEQDENKSWICWKR